MTEVDPIGIRAAKASDDAGLTSLARAVWPAAYSFADPALAQHTIDHWWSSEANARSIATTSVLVAESSSNLVGMGNIDLRPDVPVIWKLAVHPKWQGARIGLRLIKQLLGLAADTPVRLAYVEGNDHAAAFYASLGFEPVSRNDAERPEWPGEIVVEIPPAAPFRLRA